MSRRKVLLPRPLSPTHRMLNDSTCSKARASSCCCCSSEGDKASASAWAMLLRSDSGGASEGAADEAGQESKSESI